MAQLVP
jgi:predicted outer membrane repeat protein